jgi:MFS family permease
MRIGNIYYGWILVFLSIIVLAVHALSWYSFGIFLRPITIEFNWERGAFSVALAINMFIVGFLSLPVGRLSDKYGPRPLLTINGILTALGFFLLSRMNSLWHAYLIWGLLMSVAGSCSFVPVVSMIPRWFVRARGKAMGITVTGIGLGGVISAPLAQWLISNYGWRQAYIVLGLISLVVITALAQWMKRSPQQMGLQPYGESEATQDEHDRMTAGLSLRQALRTSRFWFWGLILACFFFVLEVMLVHIAPYAVDIGVSAVVAAGIVSVIAGGSAIGRLAIGFVADVIGTRLALTICLVSTIAALIWLLFAQEVWMLYLFAVVYGIAYGGVVPLETLLTEELFGLRFLGVILGALMFLLTIGSSVGSPLAGYIFDVTGTYHLAFIICIILLAVALSFSLILLRTRSEKSAAIPE